MPFSSGPQAERAVAVYKFLSVVLLKGEPKLLAHVLVGDPATGVSIQGSEMD